MHSRHAAAVRGGINDHKDMLLCGFLKTVCVNKAAIVYTTPAIYFIRLAQNIFSSISDTFVELLFYEKTSSAIMNWAATSAQYFHALTPYRLFYEGLLVSQGPPTKIFFHPDYSLASYI